MAKIGFFILPPAKLKKKIYNFKKEIHAEYGNQTYLNHLPHLTLFTLNINNTNLLYERILKFQIDCTQYKKIKIRTSKFGYFLNDPFTDGNTQYISINKNNKLSNLQYYLLKKFQNLHVRKKDDKRNLFSSVLLNKNLNKYGFPYIGKIWIPHFTICSFNKTININEIIIKNKKITINEDFDVKKISIFKINKFSHKHLVDIKL